MLRFLNKVVAVLCLIGGLVVFGHLDQFGPDAVYVGIFFWIMAVVLAKLSAKPKQQTIVVRFFRFD